MAQNIKVSRIDYREMGGGGGWAGKGKKNNNERQKERRRERERESERERDGRPTDKSKRQADTTRQTDTHTQFGR